MSDNSTRKFLGMYEEIAEAPGFLSGFFQTPPENFHNSEKVEVDIIRDDEDIAIPVQGIASGGRKNEANKYVNKSYAPPVFKEELELSAHDLIKRPAGDQPFADPVYATAATKVVFSTMGKVERKIRRSIELMASQVFADGALSLLDESSNSIFSMDFSMKSTHKITVGATWSADGNTGNPIGDVEAAAVVVRRDGKKQPTKLVFGTTAMQRWLANSKVLARLDNRQMSLGQIAPVTRGQGATFYGYVWIGNYRFEMWMYDGYYKDPITDTFKPYVNDEHVLMLSDGAQLSLSFGNIPFIARPDSRAMSFLPRLSSPARGLDLIPNAWVSLDGLALTVQLACRPLTIPTAIDTFARIKMTT